MPLILWFQNYFFHNSYLAPNNFLHFVTWNQIIFPFLTPGTKLFLTVYFSADRMILFYEKVLVLSKVLYIVFF